MASRWSKRRLVDAEVKRFMDLYSSSAVASHLDVPAQHVSCNLAAENVAFCQSQSIDLLNESTSDSSLQPVNCNESDVHLPYDSEQNSGRPTDMDTEMAANDASDDYYIYSTSEYETSDSASDDHDDHCLVDDDDTFEADIASWAIEFNICHTALSSLLKILSSRLQFLPKDARTLLKTERKVITKKAASGEYFHVGIVNGVLDVMASNACTKGTEVSIQVNIDGIPLQKSSNMQMWPILGRIHNDQELFGSDVHNCSPFVIGVYQGASKPSCVADFFKDFVSEATELQNIGIAHGSPACIHPFKIAAFVCDMSARAMIKCVKGHGAYGGCDRCTQHGIYKNKVVYPDCNAPLRTDSSFIAMSDEIHHIQECPLNNLNVGMVSNFVLDYMHLVCLGVVRKLTSLWLGGPLKIRLGPLSKKLINDSLLSCQVYMPSDFSRKPRPLTEFEKWKATEFRSFLLYTGPICLSEVLAPELYQNFLLLSVSITILLSDELCLKFVDYSRELLILFVKHFSDIYGMEYVTYNVHALVHLHMDAKLYGSLDRISAFPFENRLGMLKRMIRQPTFPLQQLIRRLFEKQSSQVESSLKSNNGICTTQLHCHGPLITDINVCEQFCQVIIRDVLIKLSPRDQNVQLKNGDIVSVQNIVTDRTGKVYLLYKKFHENGSFFTYPLQSALIGIFKFSHLGSKIHSCSVDKVKSKYVILQHSKAQFVGFPLLHTAE